MYTPTMTTDLVGQILGTYRLTRVLGKGGMSVVFLGQAQHARSSSVAIKILVPSADIPWEQRRLLEVRFHREAQTMMRLHHEHILPILDYGEDHGMLYIVMPYLSGGTLASRLHALGRPLPFSEITRYINQLACALDYAHQQGVIHRDIKPTNMLLDEQGNMYLTDFGIARLSESSFTSATQVPTTLTEAGGVLGTPAYMAPERFLDASIGPEADIYALGIVLYLLVTGRVPFHGPNALAIGMQHVHEAPLSPRTLRPELPVAAESAILRALAKDPASRFVSAGALAQAFEEGLEGRWVQGKLPFDERHAQRTAQVVEAAPLLVKGEQQESRSAVPLEEKPTVSQRGWRVTPGHASTAIRGVLVGLLLIGMLFLAVLFNGQHDSGAMHTSLKSTAISTPTSALHPTTVPTHSARTGSGSVQVSGNTVSGPRAGDGHGAWQVTTQGQISQPPIVQQHVVYIATNAGYVYGLRLETGQLLWSSHVDGPVTAFHVSNGIVIVNTTNGSVYRLRADDGQVLSHSSPGNTPVAPSPGTGTTPQPTQGTGPTATPFPTQGVTPTVAPSPTQEASPAATPEETQAPDD